MFLSLSGYILLCQDVSFSGRMSSFLSGCIIPCQDVFFLVRTYFHLLSGCIISCQDTCFSVSLYVLVHLADATRCVGIFTLLPVSWVEVL